VVEAVAQGMILDEELGGERCISIERHRRRAIEFFVGERSNRVGGSFAVTAQEVQDSSAMGEVDASTLR